MNGAPATRRQLERVLPIGGLDGIIGAPSSVIRSVEKRRRARKWDAEGSKKPFNDRKELGWRELDFATAIDKVRLWLHDFNADVYEVRAAVGLCRLCPRPNECAVLWALILPCFVAHFFPG